ncbi:type 1 glutamine amidotransferase domain-containing protein [Tropicimonas sp. IMCC34011]|uniref:type 1 glutamine amidotransferase domain-containing protein n=1 Tax=Tropicimonas sp. IMCC34011 TaxID=2248759 RepID=UPI000E270B81|nr:type 1 glutamine amidotransferase domain-containing protein [Tropicimonas sp. IMCC34011]
MKHTALLVVTSHDETSESGHETGFDFQEVAAIYIRLREAGLAVRFASPKGGKPSANSSSTDAFERSGAVDLFLGDARAVAALSDTATLGDVDATRFDALILAGGPGALHDFPGDSTLARLAGTLWDRGAIVSGIGCGIAGLLGARRHDGLPLLAGKSLTGPVAAELTEIGAARSDAAVNLPGSLADSTMTCTHGPPGEPYVVSDGRLITGQNAASASEVALQILDAIDAFPREAATA